MNLLEPCPEFASRIPESLDGQFSPADRAALAAHLAACPACQAFAEACRSLDATLQTAIHTRPLAPDFNQRLWRRIAAESPPLSEGEREAKKRAWAADFEARTRTWRRRTVSLTTLLDGVGYGVVASAFGLAVWHWVPKLLDGSVLPVVAKAHGDVASAVLTGMILVVAMVVAFARPARRFPLLPAP